MARVFGLLRVIPFALMTLAVPAVALAGPLQDDLAARRARMLERLDPATLAVVWSAPTRIYSLDVDYEYRQDSNLLYLTGINQDETTLVLMPGNATAREILFVREPDPRREHWEGHVLTKEEVTALSGISTVYYRREFEPFLAAMFSGLAYGGSRGEYESFFDAVRDGRARLALPLGPRPGPSAPLPQPYEFARQARDRFLNISVVDTWPILAELRQVKTAYEQTLLERSGEVSSQAHLAGMRAARPGRFEYEVEAAIEHVFLQNGAMSPGYPSIVGSGPNATILHYISSSRQTQQGDLLLVDAGASYQGYTVDITRTYPVDGVFTDAQKDVYRIVLEAQEAGIQAARVGGLRADIEQAASAVIKDGLLALGLITDVSGQQFRTWYTHGAVHWIGMDVHDVGDYARPLEPGMAFTIEPGIYVRPDALDNLANSPSNEAFRDQVRVAVERYQHIGVRVEDSFLLTEDGPRNLSVTVPRTIEDIERFMATGGEGREAGR